MRQLLLISLAILGVACADLTAPQADRNTRFGVPKDTGFTECVMRPDTTTLTVDGQVFTVVVWKCF